MSSPLTATDLWTLPRVGQPVPLPDGNAAIVPVTTHDLATNEPATMLYRVTRDGSTQLLTTKQASHPAVSPSGDRISFVRPPTPDGKAQLHVMALGGGEATALTDLPLGVGESLWLPDGTGLIAVVPLLAGHNTPEATGAELEARRERHQQATVTEDRVYRYWKRWLVDGQVHHLFHIDAATGEARDLTPGLNRLLSSDADPRGTFDISPDGRDIAVAVEVDQPGRPYLQFAIHTVPVDGGELYPLSAELPAQQLRPRYSPDGGTLVYGVQMEHAFYADRVRLAAHDLAGGTMRLLTEEWDGSAEEWEFWGGESIVFSAEHHGRRQLFVTDLVGAVPKPIDSGTGSWHGPQPASDTIWCRTESAAAPPEVGFVDNDAAGRVSCFAADELTDRDLGRTDAWHVTGADGDQIEVKLVYPPDFDPDEQWPLLHNVHGGPHGLVGDDWHWRWNTQVFAAAGYVVASVNFHGSTSWGEGFTGSIRGAWGDKTYTDVMAATDALLATGFIDGDRMAIAGGSYGGYLVTWITTRTDRFKAAVCHAGVTDLLGQWATDTTEGREKAIGGVPWEDMEAVQRWSPMAHTDRIVTPTLIVHGELDYRVVVTQGLVLYGVLKHKGVPARLVYYPDEGHWIESPANSIHWYREVLDWLGRWV